MIESSVSKEMKPMWSKIKESGERLVYDHPVTRGIPKLVDLIQAWGIDRNITVAGGCSGLSQMPKLLEEYSELNESLNTGNKLGVKDGIGDMLVVLIQVMRLEGLTLGDCLEQAYNEIKDRTGHMENGIFVKDQVNNPETNGTGKGKTGGQQTETGSTS